MTKKDIFILFSPNIWLLYLTVVAFLGPHTFQKHFKDADQFQETQRSFERFATNVQSGKVRLTQEKMLDYMSSGDEYAESEYEVSTSLLGVLQRYAWELVIAIIWQVGAVLIVCKRLRKKLQP
jgi:hypothetical protein